MNRDAFRATSTSATGRSPTGPLVKPGNPDTSTFFLALSGKSPFDGSALPQMPDTFPIRTPIPRPRTISLWSPPGSRTALRHRSFRFHRSPTTPAEVSRSPGGDMPTWLFQRVSLRIPQLVLICSILSVFPVGHPARAAQQDQPFDVTTYHYDFNAHGMEFEGNAALAGHAQEWLIWPVESGDRLTSRWMLSRSSFPGSDRRANA